VGSPTSCLDDCGARKDEQLGLAFPYFMHVSLANFR
jgi:hypothetical protein